MSYLNALIADLREKRLWPVAVALLVALVAVPVLLGGKTSATPPAQVTPLSAPVTQIPGYPAVSIQKFPTVSKLDGPARDPFIQQKLPSAAAPSTSTTSTITTTPTGTTGSGGSSASTGAGTGAGTTTTPSVAPMPPSSLPAHPVKPAPPGLTARQAYHVTISITNSAGGLDTIDPVQRLSPIPSEKRPLLIELGVLKGGNRVLFAVQPGTVVSGPGTCTPGPIDCEILSLGQDQVEQLSMQTATAVVPVAQFAVTAIQADQYSSAAAATKARALVSSAGSRLLSASTLGALSLFQYQPGLGAVVDLRNLTIGGS
jgi:hypothetical protein